MVEYKYLGHDFEYAKYCVKAEPNHVFEYEKTAYRLADEVNGEVVELYTTHLWEINFVTEDECEFIGYGVIKDAELL